MEGKRQARIDALIAKEQAKSKQSKQAAQEFVQNFEQERQTKIETNLQLAKKLEQEFLELANSASDNIWEKVCQHVDLKNQQEQVQRQRQVLLTLKHGGKELAMEQTQVVISEKQKSNLRKEQAEQAKKKEIVVPTKVQQAEPVSKPIVVPQQQQPVVAAKQPLPIVETPPKQQEIVAPVPIVVAKEEEQVIVPAKQQATPIAVKEEAPIEAPVAKQPEPQPKQQEEAPSIMDQGGDSDIWDLLGTAQSSMDILLENPSNVKLTQVLDEETVINDVLVEHQQLLSFLCAHADELLTMLTYEPYREDGAEFDESSMCKYPYMACEVLCCNNNTLIGTIIKSEKLLNLLLGYFRRPTNKNAHNTSIAKNVSKFILLLLPKYYKELVAVIMKDKTYLQTVFVNSVLLCDMDQIVLQFLGYDTSDAQNTSSALSNIKENDTGSEFTKAVGNKKIASVQLLPDSTKQAIVQLNKWGVENHLAKAWFNLLKEHLSDDDASRNILDMWVRVLNKDAGISDITANSIQTEEFIKQVADLVMANVYEPIYMRSIPFFQALLKSGNTVLLPYVNTIVSLLQSPKALPSMPMTFGVLQAPLGEARLVTIEFLHHIIQAKAYHEAICASNVIPILVDLFFTYEHNNLMHQWLMLTFVYIIQASNDAGLKQQLLNHGKFATKCVQESTQYDPAKHTPGYTGHEMRVIQALQDSKDDTIVQMLAQVEGWKAFTDGFVAQVKQRYNTAIGGNIPLQDAGKQTVSHVEDDHHQQEEEHHNDSNGFDDDDFGSKTFDDDEEWAPPAQPAKPSAATTQAPATTGFDDDFGADFDTQF